MYEKSSLGKCEVKQSKSQDMATASLFQRHDLRVAGSLVVKIVLDRW